MTDAPKKGWFEEEAERREAERQVAIERRFDALVKEGKIADTKEAWAGFVYGWYGTLTFQNAKRELNEAGSGGTQSAMLLWLIGGMISGLAAMVLLFFPHEEIAIDRTVGMLCLGPVLIALGFRSAKSGSKKYAAALAKHKAEWGKQ